MCRECSGLNVHVFPKDIQCPYLRGSGVQWEFRVDMVTGQASGTGLVSLSEEKDARTLPCLHHEGTASRWLSTNLDTPHGQQACWTWSLTSSPQSCEEAELLGPETGLPLACGVGVTGVSLMGTVLPHGKRVFFRWCHQLMLCHLMSLDAIDHQEDYASVRSPGS